MIRLRNFISQSAILFFLFLLVADTAGAGPESAVRRVVVIDKARKELSVFQDGQRVGRFTATFGIDPVSDKRRIHDLATPEGLYFVTYKNARTRFHRSLGLSYPNLADAQRGLASGVVSESGYRRVRTAVRRGRPTPCDTGLGCAIAIHGGGVRRQFGEFLERDWTEGCVALDNRDMDVLFRLCRPGDPVIVFNSARNLFGIIRPFTEAVGLDDGDLPLCPDGVCTYSTTLRTWLGPATVTVREGAEVSLEVVVHGENGPVLAITDRNADGEISFLDSVGGTMADASAPESAYALVRCAIVAALSSGALPRSDASSLAVSRHLD